MLRATVLLPEHGEDVGGSFGNRGKGTIVRLRDDRGKASGMVIGGVNYPMGYPEQGLQVEVFGKTN